MSELDARAKKEPVGARSSEGHADTSRVHHADTAGDAFAWGEPQRLFPLENYRSADPGRMWDVTPGDYRFLMLRIVPGEVPTELIVVENFFEELQAKVKR